MQQVKVTLGFGHLANQPDGDPEVLEGLFVCRYTHEAVAQALNNMATSGAVVDGPVTIEAYKVRQVGGDG